MAFFIIRMLHTDDKGWAEHLDEYIAYLYKFVREGVVRASGKVVDAPVKTGCILITAPDRAAADAIVAADPFSKAGLVEDLRIFEWDPFIGIFAAEASGPPPGGTAKAD